MQRFSGDKDRMRLKTRVALLFWQRNSCFLFMGKAEKMFGERRVQRKNNLIDKSSELLK